MTKANGSTVVKTPMGLTVPLLLYAASIAALIAAGSAASMYKLSYPWWVWIVEALILFPIVYRISRNSAKGNDSGDYVIVTESRVIAFATISAIVIALLIIMIAVL